MKIFFFILACIAIGVGLYYLKLYLDKKNLEREIDSIKIPDDTFDLPENLDQNSR